MQESVIYQDIIQIKEEKKKKRSIAVQYAFTQPSHW